jgi:hypothetical protein
MLTGDGDFFDIDRAFVDHLSVMTAPDIEPDHLVNGHPRPSHTNTPNPNRINEETS